MFVIQKLFVENRRQCSVHRHLVDAGVVGLRSQTELEQLPRSDDHKSILVSQI
jgi:hypothetical protein